jgi:hypothetical protein
MPLVRCDSFWADDAQDKGNRRQKLIELLQGTWVNEDIQEIERVVSDGQQGWAMQRHNPEDPWRNL